MDDQRLLAEIDELIREFPLYKDFELSTAQSIEWGGRAVATIELVDSVKFLIFGFCVENALTGKIHQRMESYPKIGLALQRAKSMLILRLPSVRSSVINQGARFRYFDEVTKIIKAAQTELYFVDPFLNNDFVSRYLEPLTKSLKIKLLGKKATELSSLVQGCKLLKQQGQLQLEIKSTASIHDRYVFIDGKQCFMSGASFKDGATSASTVIVEIVDAFDAMKRTYDGLWSSAKQEL